MTRSGRVAGEAPPQPTKGRGAVSNPAGRFEKESREAADDGWELDDTELKPLGTEVVDERPKTILASNRSPDIPFERSINPYKGCEHGCVYCYARPSHAYMGLSAGLDFESRLFAKPDAARLLERELARPGYRPTVIALGANTDPYQPIERQRKITRSVLEVLSRAEHPVAITTKSNLVCRDIDILAPMAARNLVAVGVSVTSLDGRLARRLEPRAPRPEKRLEAIAQLATAGIPVAVMVAPVIPVLTDWEIERILEAAAAAGASGAAYILLRLPREVKDLFKEWLAAHAPDTAAHVLNQVRETRAGALSDANFGTRMSGTGERARLIARRFDLACARLGLDAGRAGDLALDLSRFRPPAPPGGQLSLF